MANINLRPWRAELREELKKEFLTILLGVFGAGAVLAGLGMFLLSQAIDNQNARNAFLKSEISVLDKRIKEIRNLKKERERLKERMRVIADLQGNRPIIVRVFDELARTLPGGVFYKKVDLKGKRLTLAGTAESNNKVSSLMRQFDKSEWFKQPLLSGVQANPGFGEEASDFTMRVTRTAPGEEEEKKQQQKKKGKKKKRK